jgi:hypothetical protein
MSLLLFFAFLLLFFDIPFLMDKLSQKDREPFIRAATIQAAIATESLAVTDICFEKCVKLKSSTLDNWEKSCLQNCHARFLDTLEQIVKSE